MTRDMIIKAEEKFLISGQEYTNGILLDNTECSILIDISVSKSYMSKSYYMQCKSLHALPKFASTMQRAQVGNGQCVGELFVIPLIIDICRHRFEVFMLVLEIHDNVDLVLGIKNVFELEREIDMWDSSFTFLNRSIPLQQIDVFELEREIDMQDSSFKRTGIIETKRKEIYKDRSIICR